ncbi:hypothetical protein GUITHDRAFT_119517 [Guillardia theta CCMP2712]|uniref:RWP-RK domain-containing protein n=1 Tax=Guillardia theta (strain CCMP2712) TaxID=905079 RepID=L1IEP0_GUITC|nr:hypothetical protein GUITHDRAFT_119517 [Guillardia theta CCMP2712]EKX34285.1 hypothetical protein GUITHDRAFT_119517 [Guillardia theta CCMP2712]|eukprot:XP_005821265.1 hypothetical protein GUITHDRAFT_119517 [Guillardia theta CCMP2712]
MPHVTISPRPRGPSSVPSTALPEVKISTAVLEPLFRLSMKDAASRLGVSTTSLKAACRKLGISRWPSHRAREQGLYRRAPAGLTEGLPDLTSSAPSSRAHGTENNRGLVREGLGQSEGSRGKMEQWDVEQAVDEGWACLEPGWIMEYMKAGMHEDDDLGD